MTDTPPPPEVSAGLRIHPLAEMVHALGFLTRLPIPLIRTLDPPPLSQTMRMFSIVGALLGASVGAIMIGLQSLHVPILLAALLAVAAGLLLTGALHEDGLADMADGIGGGKTRERRLEIMRDSRIGSYGALALGIAVSARMLALAGLITLPWTTILLLTAAAGAFSRAMVVDLLWATKPARSDGLSFYAGRPSRNVAVFTIVVGLALSLSTGFLVRPEAGVIAVGLGLATTAVLRRMAVRQLGGQTGDVCGAVQVTCEVVMLTVFAAMIN